MLITEKEKLASILIKTASALDIPDHVYEDATLKYEEVGGWLGAPGSPLERYAPEIYPQGSFRLGTVVRPIAHYDYDIDLVCLLKLRKEETTQEKLKQMVGDRLKDPPRWDYILTGRLRIDIGSVEFSSIHKSWADGKRRKLEDSLGEVLVMCETRASAIRQAREERAETERKWAEEQQRRAEEAARRAEYERKTNAVKKLSEAWNESQLIWGFVAALRAATASAKLSEDSKRELQSMIDWTTNHADYLDPCTDLKWAVEQFKKQYWF